MPIDPIVRELAVTYNGITIGGTSQNLLLCGSRYRVSRDLVRATVEFEFVVLETAEGAFASTCAAVEAALSTPFKALAIQQGSQQLLAYGTPPATECRPRIEKTGDEETDTGRSRKYRVAVECDLPASWSTTSGLREFSADLSLSPSGRKTVRLSGTFTGVGATSARGRYDAAIDALASSTLSGFGGTYELVGQPRAAHDLNNHLLSFDREYREVIFEQGGATLNDPAIVEQQLTLRSDQPAPGDSPDPAGGSDKPATRLAEITADYEAWIARSVTQDLETKYGSIRTWLVSKVKETFGASSLAIVSERKELLPDDNRIRASLRFLAPLDGQTVYERRVTVADEDDDNEVLVPAMDGNRFSRYAYDSPTPWRRTVTETTKRIGSFGIGAALSRAKELRAAFADGNWTRGVARPSVTPIRLGRDSEGLDATEVEVSIAFERFDSPGGGRGTSAPQRPARPARTPGGGGARVVVQGGSLSNGSSPAIR